MYVAVYIMIMCNSCLRIFHNNMIFKSHFRCEYTYMRSESVCIECETHHDQYLIHQEMYTCTSTEII